jgi:hypothetical protein
VVLGQPHVQQGVGGEFFHFRPSAAHSSADSPATRTTSEGRFVVRPAMIPRRSAAPLI